MIDKAIIPVAGLGTRLTPATKEQPKEMLPIFDNMWNGQISIKPIVQLIFESLYEFGVRNFYFVIGRGKRVIEDHFTQDHNYLLMLTKKDKNNYASELSKFYQMLDRSKLVWINQPEPKGFGEAVLRVKPLIADDKFLVHAGDAYIISGNGHLNKLMQEYERLNADAILTLQEVQDPRQYGVAEIDRIDDDLAIILDVEEKPVRPKSKMAIMPIYIFNETIFEAIEKITPGKHDEIQLTDAIQKLIEWKRKVYGIKLGPNQLRLDVGNPEMYWNALRTSYSHAHNL